MITEQGAIKVATQINSQLQKEASKKAVNLYIVLIVIFSIIGAISFIALCINTSFSPFFWTLLSVVFIILFSIALRTISKNAKKADEVMRINTYEFFADRFGVVDRRNGQIIGNEIKMYFEIQRATETQHYILLYTGANTFYPVDKTMLSDAERNTLRAIFRLNVRGGTLALPMLTLEILPYTTHIPPQPPVQPTPQVIPSQPPVQPTPQDIPPQPPVQPTPQDIPPQPPVQPIPQDIPPQVITPPTPQAPAPQDDDVIIKYQSEQTQDDTVMQTMAQEYTPPQENTAQEQASEETVATEITNKPKRKKK